MVLEPVLQLVKRVLRTRTDSREWRNGRERRNTKRRREGLDLSLEKTKSSRRFCQSTQTRREWSLEGGHIRVQLSQVSFIPRPFTRENGSLHP